MAKRKDISSSTLSILIGLILLYWVLQKFGEQWLRSLLLYLSGANWARNLVTRLPLAKQVASRFVAGETIGEAMGTTQALNERGFLVTLDYLGESVTSIEEAAAARDEILKLLKQIHARSSNANVSVKLSQLGLKLDPNIALENMKLLLTCAHQLNNRIRIDMEESAVTDITLNIYRRLRDEFGFQNTGVVIQAYLYRSEKDVAALVDEGSWVRLCKGAYAEPPEVAFPAKADTDKNFVKLMQNLLSEEARENGVYLGIATHDEKMIQATQEYIRQHNIAPHEYEFQMLYGIRREMQESLLDRGQRVRIYVPYGMAWYPYFVRRLAERPANLWFFISNLFRN